MSAADPKPIDAEAEQSVLGLLREIGLLPWQATMGGLTVVARYVIDGRLEQVTATLGQALEPLELVEVLQRAALQVLTEHE
jgi:hypothetical protein